MLQQDKKDLQEEVRELTRELMETNRGVLALIQEFEKNNKQLLHSDQEKTEFLEKLKRSNKEQLEKIRAQEEALIQADKMASLGQLVAGVAHEINNPTTYIRGSIELLQKYWQRAIKPSLALENDELNSYAANFENTLEVMYKGTKRIMEIVNGLKFFARQEKTAYEVFDLRECVEESYKLVKNEFMKNKIRFHYNSDGEKYLVNGSLQQMEQVFINLLLNALTAIKNAGSPQTGLVEVDILRADNNLLQVSLKDNGCGISEKNLNQIFNPFFTTNQASGGTGLGLSIVYGIIQEHGGKIEIKSEEKQGTEFILHLKEYVNELG